MRSTFDLVCLSHLRWYFVRQRPQHLMSRCAADRRVLYVEEPTYGDDGPWEPLAGGEPRMDVSGREGGVTVYVPRLPGSVDGEEAEAMQQALLDELLDDEETRWEFGERATLRVAKPGGLAPGEHTIEVVQHLRIPYMPQGLRGADTKTISLDGHGGGT